MRTIVWTIPDTISSNTSGREKYLDFEKRSQVWCPAAKLPSFKKWFGFWFLDLCISLYIYNCSFLPMLTFSFTSVNYLYLYLKELVCRGSVSSYFPLTCPLKGEMVRTLSSVYQGPGEGWQKQTDEMVLTPLVYKGIIKGNVIKIFFLFPRVFFSF